MSSREGVRHGGGDTSASPEGRTTSPGRLQKSLPGGASQFFPTLKGAKGTTLALEARLLLS